MTKHMKAVIIDRYQSGVSMDLIAIRLRLDLWRVEAVIREALRAQGRTA